MNKPATIKISAKCSDMFCADFFDKEGKMVGSYTGYVPKFFPNPNVEHYGDYVELVIDLSTGLILNWKKPTAAQLESIND